MAKKNLISFLPSKDTPSFDGLVHYKNPLLFKGRVPAYADYVISDNPDIVKAYTDKGVEDYAKVYAKSSGSGASGSTSVWSKPTKPSDGPPRQCESSEYPSATQRGELLDGLQTEKQVKEEERQVIPEDWESLNFFKQRSIARGLTDEPVNNKEDVLRVIRKFV